MQYFKMNITMQLLTSFPISPHICMTGGKFMSLFMQKCSEIWMVMLDRLSTKGYHYYENPPKKSWILSRYFLITFSSFFITLLKELPFIFGGFGMLLISSAVQVVGPLFFGKVVDAALDSMCK